MDNTQKWCGMAVYCSSGMEGRCLLGHSGGGGNPCGSSKGLAPSWPGDCRRWPQDRVSTPFVPHSLGYTRRKLRDTLNLPAASCCTALAIPGGCASEGHAPLWATETLHLFWDLPHGLGPRQRGWYHLCLPGARNDGRMSRCGGRQTTERHCAWLRWNEYDILTCCLIGGHLLNCLGETQFRQ